MKVETCVTISEELLKELDDCADGKCSRSEFVEEALRKHIEQVKSRKKHRMTAEEEIEKINRYVEENREEIEDNLRFQAELMLEALDKK
ncbi:MAG TPA: type II toxin-antitoxin system CcdA family antitoxin [Pyrinomonadaceae bacterium]|jgi:metal-responsive CopG/Arc/MetJ family transcriptional regulator